MGWVTEKFHRNHKDLTVYVIFFLLSLRVINWFEYPYVLVSGDIRPPLVLEAFIKRVLYSWDETDLGIPSVYAPRILDPFNFFITIFQTLGINLYFSQIVAVFLMYFLASIFMYFYVNQLTNGDTIAAFVAALFLTSNIHLIVDREQTAIGFINATLMILPCLATFTRGIKTKSYMLIVISGLLFNFTYGAFPNYRVTLLCLMALAVTCLFLFMNSGLRLNHSKNNISNFLNISLNVNLLSSSLRFLLVFVTSLLLASIWVITLVRTNLEALFVSYKNMAAPHFVLYIQPYDVLRLAAKWAFYEKGLGKPYVPYADVYFDNPLIAILSFFPSILAFMSLLFSKSRKLTIYFSGVAMFSLLLTSGFNPDFSQLYFALTTHVPLMIAFRESTHWILFIIMSYGILIGMTLSSLCHKLKHKKWQIFAISLVIALFVLTSFPLITGDVTRNWLNTDIKGSYFAPSYPELNSMLPKEYWVMMLPQRGTYVIYNFSESSLGCGNPYPLIFSKPVISGVGTEYTQSRELELINELYKRIRTDINYRNIAPEGKASVSSNGTDKFTPDKAIDGQMWTRWSSKTGVPQWFEIEWNKPQEVLKINIFFESAYANDYIIEVWNGSDWTTLVSLENNNSTYCEHAFSKPTFTNKLRVSFTKASPFGSISIWELEAYARTDVVPNFLGMVGIKYLVLEKNIVSGNTSSVDELRIRESENFNLVKEWEEIELFENVYALQKLYVAGNVLNYVTVCDIYTAVEKSEWDTLQRSVFVDANFISKTMNTVLILPENFAWSEINPTRYEANVESNGPFILVFLEGYYEGWKLYVNGSLIPESSHLKVNGFANGWLIEDAGSLMITVQYETQNLIAASAIASLILPTLLLAFLSRKDIVKIIRTLKTKAKFSKLSKITKRFKRAYTSCGSSTGLLIQAS